MTKGFTVVELLIALVVAGIFLMGSFQLYQVVNLRNAEAREMSEASNIAYSVLRKEGSINPSTTPPVCTAHDPAPTIVPYASSLPMMLPEPVQIKLYRCLPIENANVTKVMVRVEYGRKGDFVTHATYIPK